jgi:L-ascorbate metabolism protein UlaG (beta-lactamase superfamily)
VPILVERIKMFVIAGIIISVLLIAVCLGCSSQLGARSKGESLKRVRSSSHFKGRKFINLEDTTLMDKDASLINGTIQWIKGTENGVPQYSLPSEKFDKKMFLKKGNGIGLVWFGHSTALLNIDGHIVLTDPVFSKNPSPVYLGNRAFDYIIDAKVEDLPEIDTVVISHDHYDHLDMVTIKKLKDKVKLFAVPLGVAAHLIRWGIPEELIIELDWWQEYSLRGISFTSAPARHFSGRGIFDVNATLWCSWVIQSGGRKIFFSGDTGYGKHFEQIGQEFGPFDLVLMECGQYGKDWPLIHMSPEETLKAFDDVRGKVLLPVHWGKFKLSLHSWTEPVERVRAGMESRMVITPVMGSYISTAAPSSSFWWQVSKQENYKRKVAFVGVHEVE